MLLTEPQAGSDLGALTTSAKKNPDGTYSITGNKIFITNGEQNLTENIIHPVLARIEGAPAGTKGISIFIVPKVWVNDDGSQGEFNDVVCTGVEEKMGLHGSPTCSLALGGKNACRGWLLGEENQGMQIMFHMMNGVRLEVGTQAFTHASCSYLHALDYASQRLQGRSIDKGRDHSAPQVAIINHPDVRRMLTKMKAYVEGMRSLLYYTALCFDKAHLSESQEDKKRYNSLIEILTPVIKSYCAEKGFDVCVEGMQVFGGYGYTREYPMEQLVRDCKITSIYEGANGIQAMDFLGRKIIMSKGAFLDALVNAMRKTIDSTNQHSNLNKLGTALSQAADRLCAVAMKTAQAGTGPGFKHAFAFAHPLMEATGDVVMAWMLLWRAVVAESKLSALVGEKDEAKVLDKNKNAAFYHGKIVTAEFFIRTMLPVTLGKLDAIDQGKNAAVKMRQNAF